jgi:WD40 repeat protein
VDVSPDGRLLAVGLDYPAGGLQLVDLEAGEIVATLHDVDAVGGLAFTPDGSLLAAAGVDGDVTFVDPAARRRLGDPFLAVDGTFTGLEFSPDGAHMLTTGSDGVVSLWDVAERTPISRIVVGNPNVASFAWFGDGGRTIVAADALGGVWSLPSDPDSWERAACDIAGRSLTRVEWREHIPGRPYHPACD